MSHLVANLTALARNQRDLAERLCWPVSDTQVRQSPQGLERAHRRAWQPLTLGAADSLALEHFVATSTQPLVLGVGDGVDVTRILNTHAAPPLTVWERDPWLLRLWLCATPLAAFLESGALRLALGSDLLKLRQQPGMTFWAHPVLQHQYAPEWHWLKQSQPPSRFIAMGTGELMVDGLAEAFGEVGYAVWPLDLGLLSVEELRHQVQQVAPVALVVINYKQGLAEFTESLKLPLLTWEIDPTTDRMTKLATPANRSFFFTYRESQRAELVRAGFRHIHYLPLAAHPRLRAPVPMSDPERERYAVPVAFVGSSMVDQLERHRQTWLTLCTAIPGAPTAPELLRRLDALLTLQAQDDTQNLIPALWETEFADLAPATRTSRQDPLQLIGEMAAAAKRLRYLRALGGLGLHVWGDAGFASLAHAGVNYRGPAGYTDELNKIYSHARINLDIGRLYQSDIVTLRVFDVLSCGGFVLCEQHPVLEALFTVGEDLDVYRTPEDLRAKVSYYTAHPEQAQRLAAAGHAKVLREHTLTARAQTLLKTLETTPG